MRDPEIDAMVKCLTCGRRSPRVGIFRYGWGDVVWQRRYTIGDTILWGITVTEPAPPNEIDGEPVSGRYLVGCYLEDEKRIARKRLCDHCPFTESEFLWYTYDGVIELIDGQIRDVYFRHKTMKPDYVG